MVSVVIFGATAFDFSIPSKACGGFSPNLFSYKKGPQFFQLWDLHNLIALRIMGSQVTGGLEIPEPC